MTDKTKRQLRAEAVERVEKLRGSDASGYDLLNAIFGEAPNDGTWKIDSDIAKFHDLLTDDEPTEGTCAELDPQEGEDD